MPSEITILIVDDDELHLRIYRWILERESYRCRTALVGNTSVEFPGDEAVDLVLLDYRLQSSLTAVDLAKELKSRFPNAPIVVLSELTWIPEDIRPYAAGFVHKGEPKLLVETIGDLLLPASERTA